MEEIKIHITDITSSGVISVLTQTYIKHGGQEILIKNNREPLVPGQFDRAKEILPCNLYRAMEEIWSPEVIEAWEEKTASLEESK